MLGFIFAPARNAASGEECGKSASWSRDSLQLQAPSARPLLLSSLSKNKNRELVATADIVKFCVSPLISYSPPVLVLVFSPVNPAKMANMYQCIRGIWLNKKKGILITLKKHSQNTHTDLAIFADEACHSDFERRFRF